VHWPFAGTPVAMRGLESCEHMFHILGYPRAVGAARVPRGNRGGARVAGGAVRTGAPVLEEAQGGVGQAVLPIALPEPTRRTSRSPARRDAAVNAGAGPFRWELAVDPSRPRLFGSDELGETSFEVVGFDGYEFLMVRAKRIVNELPPLSRMGFRYTVNPYRGCSHACTYCFARPSHEYLGLGIGRDFERRIVVKINAVELLEAELHPARWCGAAIALGTNTDPYQHCEGRFRLTRGILRVLVAHVNPFSIVTKSPLVLRDLDVLVEAASLGLVHCHLSVGTLDEDAWRATEPGTAHPRRRLEAVRRLNEAGVPTGVLVAPVIPSLTDRPEQLRAVVHAALDAGAVSVSAVPLHLRGLVRDHFLDALDRTHPGLRPHLEAAYRGAYLGSAAKRRIVGIVRDALTRSRRASARATRAHLRDRRSNRLGPDRVDSSATGR
jgi:DNA repair photolyase